MNSENERTVNIPYYFPRFSCQPDWHKILPALFTDVSAFAFTENEFQQNLSSVHIPRIEQTPLLVSDRPLYRRGHSPKSDSAATSVAAKQGGDQRQYKILQRNKNIDVWFPSVSTRQTDARALIDGSDELNNIRHGSVQQPRDAIEVLGRKSARELATISPSYCAFCYSNGETPEFYTAHQLKDSSDQITCPILQNYVCPICKATGTSAHTMKYCPNNPNPFPRSKPIRRNAIGKKVVSYN